MREIFGLVWRRLSRASPPPPIPEEPPPAPPVVEPPSLDDYAKRDAILDKKSKWGARTISLPHARFQTILHHEIGRKFPKPLRWVHLKSLMHGQAYRYSNPVPPSWLPWNMKQKRKS